MSLALYLETHIPFAVAEALRQRGVDCLTAEEDDASALPDPALLDRATALGRVLVTHDQDFLVEGPRRQQAGEFFAGIIFARHLWVSVGQLVRDLEMMAKVYDPPDLANRIEYLPL